jgi:hypothetical protein
VQAAVATLERLLKLWIKCQRSRALDLVRKHKIAWGTVLLAGSPTKTTKVKGNTITQVKSPPKPSRSPFLSGKEAQALASLFAPVWNTPDQYRIEWNKLSAQEQHSSFKDYVGMLKRHYDNVNKISTTVHAKLGHRKKWIHAACLEKGVAPSKKKDKSNEFAWTQAFYKLDLTTTNIAVALDFSPAHYLQDDKYSTNDTLAKFFALGKVLTEDHIHANNAGVCYPLWTEWARRFEPDLSLKRSTIPQGNTLEDDNPFSVLDCEKADESDSEQG